MSYLRTLGLTLVLCFAPPVAFADGVTLITHGWDPNLSGTPAWIGSMRNAIAVNHLGNERNYATITVTKPGASLVVTCSPWDYNMSTGVTGEIIIVLDWSSVANHLTGGPSAQEVADAVVNRLLTTQNGMPPVVELPIHLIGHSRGGGMVCELARLLGLRGVVVEQLTPLDPHPLTVSDPQPLPPLPAVIDTPAAIYENVIFADVYSQTPDYPEGRYLTGGYNRLWGVLTGGYFDSSAPYANHRNVYLMYQGTVDTNNPVINGEASMDQAERDAWFNPYETNGYATGFYYSRILGHGDRASSDAPNGGDQVRAGLHSDPLFGGGGPRADLVWGQAVWPNIAALALYTNDIPLGRGTHVVYPGDSVDIHYIWHDCDSGGYITFRLDEDRNPYNTNLASEVTNVHYTSTGGSFRGSNVVWHCDVPDRGVFNLCSIIADSARTRYFYAEPQLFVVPEPGFYAVVLAVFPVVLRTIRAGAVINPVTGNQ